MNLFSQRELIVMAVIVLVLLVVIVYLTILDIKEYLRGKNNEKTLIDNFGLDNDVQVDESVSNIPPVGSMVELFEEIEVIDFSEPSSTTVQILEENSFQEVSFASLKEQEKQKAQEELARVELELSSMPNKDPFEDTITRFELDQEESAIISLDELSKISNNLYDDNDIVQYDDGNEPITIDEVISKFNNSQEEVNNYSNDSFNENMLYSNSRMQFENTANYDKFDLATRSDNDFLNSLKEMHEYNEN